MVRPFRAIFGGHGRHARSQGEAPMPIGSWLLTTALLLAADPECADPPDPTQQAVGPVSGAAPLLENIVPVSTGPCGQDAAPAYKVVWGAIDGKLFIAGQRMAPNAQSYRPL